MGGVPLFAQWACKGPCGEQKGKALSGATIGSVVANSPSPLDHNAERMTQVIRFVFCVYWSESKLSPIALYNRGLFICVICTYPLLYMWNFLI